MTQPIPQGMHSVTPHLVCAGAADAIEFYKKAFGAVEAVRLPGPNGKLMHAAVRIGDSTVGAKVTMPVDEAFWGDRYGKIEDPFGHHWSVATHVRDVSPEEMQQAMTKMSA
jgi:PhnB protein